MEITFKEAGKLSLEGQLWWLVTAKLNRNHMMPLQSLSDVVNGSSVGIRTASAKKMKCMSGGGVPCCLWQPLQKLACRRGVSRVVSAAHCPAILLLASHPPCTRWIMYLTWLRWWHYNDSAIDNCSSRTRCLMSRSRKSGMIQKVEMPKSMIKEFRKQLEEYGINQLLQK